MKFIKNMFLFTTLSTTPILGVFVISCGKMATTDYKVMSWSLDQSKINDAIMSKDTFNNLENNEAKLLSIVKNENLDKYTLEALQGNWFEAISFNSNNKLTIKLFNSIEINTSSGQQTKNCPYRLPNEKLFMEM